MASRKSERHLLRPSLGARHYRFQIPGALSPCNPSLAADGEGFSALVRTVNYRLDERGVYRRDGDFTTVNWLLRLDKAFRVLEADRVDDSESHRAGPVARYGLEDGRLLRWQDSWWFVAAAKSGISPARHTIALCRLEGNRVAECRYIPSPFGLPNERNWMPRVAEGELKLVYRVSPTQIVHCRADGSYDFQSLTEPAVRFAGWSGSSQIVPYGANWLCVVHLHIREGRPGRYLHAFLELGRDFEIERFSDPWVFDGEPVEFCAGLCIAGDEAILGYGTWDREARLLRIPTPTIERLLKRGPHTAILRAINIVGGLVAPRSREFQTIAVTTATDAATPAAG